jgi:hypothetical protein
MKFIESTHPDLRTNRTKKHLARLGVSTALLLFIMFAFAFTPVIVGLVASVLGVPISLLPIGYVKEIYGALIACWMFDIFSSWLS